MKELIELLQQHLGPLVLQLLGIIFASIATLAANALRKYIGEQNTKAVVELLHMALETGVKSTMTDSGLTSDQIAESAISYAEKSIPETFSKLSPPHQVLIDIAKSKIINVLASGAKK